METKTYQIISRLSKDIPKLLNHLGIEWKNVKNRAAMPCPIHGGDNIEGYTIFLDGNKSKGNWNCWTHHCEEKYGKTILGFICGVLSKKHKKEVQVSEGVEYGLKFLGASLEDFEEVEGIDLAKEVKLLESFYLDPIREKTTITRETIRSMINIPALYFIERGFKPETLNKFDVGLCVNEGKKMTGRVVVPVYDEEGNYAGCIGRALDNITKPKWLNDLKSSRYLYGLNLAKEEILRTGNVILVEGQGDVWRMFEGGYSNTVGLFGSSISSEQIVLLEKSGCTNVTILTDNDEAGESAIDKIINKCGRRFNYNVPKFPAKDIGELSVDQIKEVMNEHFGVRR